jgi:hypothetical protein
MSNNNGASAIRKTLTFCLSCIVHVVSCDNIRVYEAYIHMLPLPFVYLSWFLLRHVYDVTCFLLITTVQQSIAHTLHHPLHNSSKDVLFFCYFFILHILRPILVKNKIKTLIMKYFLFL